MTPPVTEGCVDVSGVTPPVTVGSVDVSGVVVPETAGSVPSVCDSTSNRRVC